MKKSLLVLLLSLPLLLAGPLELVSGISPWALDGNSEKSISSSISDPASVDFYDIQIQENSKREEKREERTSGGQRELLVATVSVFPEFLESFGFDYREIPIASTYARHAVPFNKAPPV
jgi:hypothetical protein